MNYYLDIKNLLKSGDQIMISQTLNYYDRFLDAIGQNNAFLSPDFLSLFATLKSTGYLLEITPDRKEEMIYG
jgi:hypothetical protein